MRWIVGRYPNGSWGEGGKSSDYMGGWTCSVEAVDRKQARKKGQAAFYRENKKSEGFKK